MSEWLTAITAMAYALGALRLICYQRNGARYRRGISLLASAMIAAFLGGVIEAFFYRQDPGFSQAAVAVLLALLVVRSRGNVADLLRRNP